MATLKKPIKPVNTLIMTALIGLIGFILWPYVEKFTTPDESTFIYEGFLISGLGKLPYRDFFDFVLPGTFYIVALVNFLTGGVSMVALRLVALLCLGACMGITLAIGKQYLSKTWLWALGVILWFLNFPGGMEIQHHLFSTFFGMLGVWFLWQAVNKNNRQAIVTGGICIGLAAICTQSLGGLLGLSLTAFLCWQRGVKNTLYYFVLPAALPVLAVFGYFALQGAFTQLWYSTVTWLYEGGYRDTSSNTYLLDGIVKFASIVTSMLKHPSILWKRLDLVLYLPVILSLALLPPLGLLWPIEYIGKRVKTMQQKDWQLALLWFAGVGFFLATLSYPNTRLVAYHGFILVLLACMALQNLLKKHTQAYKGLVITGLCYTLIYAGLQAEQSWQMLQGPRFISYGTVEKTLVSPGYYPPDYVAAYNQLLEILHTVCPPGESLFVYNHAPEINLLSDRHNPTRFQLLMHTLDTPRQLDEATQTLHTKKPTVIIYDHLDAQNFKKDYRFKALRNEDYHLHGIEALIEQAYQPLGQLGTLSVFIRTEEK